MSTIILYIRFCLILFTISLASSMSAQCDVETNVATTDNFCDPMDSIFITLTPYGGTAPYTYTWATGATTQTISVLLVPSDIYFTVTDALGCVYSSYVHIKAGPYVAGIGGNYFLCGSSEATLNLFWYRYPPEGATYLWSTGETTPTIDITTAGAYSVTVTDPANGCSLTFDTYVDPPSPTMEIVSITEASCGQNNGAINISTAGDYTPFTWNWSNGASTEDINNLSAGTYSVTVTSSDGCTSILSATVPGNGNLNITGTTTPNNSCITNNGGVNITATPAGSYTYLWSNGGSTEDITGVPGGTYVVTVTASGGCTSTASFIVANNLNTPLANTTTTAATCGQGNGSINLTVTGGASPFSFDWSNGASTEDLSNLLPGTYSVTVTGNNGCTSTTSTIVTNSNPIINITSSASPNTSCNTGNGSINITLSPAGTYNFIWSNGLTTEDVSNLIAGSYSVTVSDDEGCSTSANISVANNLNNPNPVTTTSPASCGQDNGGVNLTISGGAAPFSFNWSNGASTEDLSDINAGTYTVTVTGDNGCTSMASATVQNTNGNININSTSSPNTSCISGNGSINLSVAPASSYNFQWSNGEDTEDLATLMAGTYIVTVTEAGGCSSIASITVTSNLDVPNATLTTIAASCGQNNGSIHLAITGGSSPFDYNWSNGSNTEDLMNIDSGSYSVTVTDVNGCTSISSAIVADDDPAININGSVIPNTSCNGSNGEINITVNPAGLYSYNWSNGATSEDLMNISAGTYQVTVSFGGACSQVAEFVVTDNNLPFEITGVLSQNNSCSMPDGSIDLSVNPTGFYSYVWSTGGITEDLQNLAEGNYTVTVSNSIGCSISASFNISDLNSGPFEVSGITGDNTSCQEPNGFIDISVTLAGSYTYSWSSGQETEDVQDLVAGNYVVTVTAAGGCTATSSFTVINNAQGFLLSGITSENASCGNPNGSIDVTITPAGDYTFIWSTGETSEDIHFLNEGSYRVTVNNSNSCATSAIFSIKNVKIETVITSVITDASCDKGNGAIDLSVLPEGDSFIWSNGATTEDLANLTTGTFTVTVTDINACTAIDTFIINNTSDAFTLSAVISENTSCVKPEGSIDLEIIPAGNYTFNWSTGATTEDLQLLSGGTYTVTVSDQTNCFSIQSFNILDLGLPSALATNIIPATCSQDNGSIDITITNSANNTYQWSNGFTGEDLVNSAPGIYSVTVTNEQGCATISSIEIPGINSSFAVTGIVHHDSSCIDPSGMIDLTITPSGAFSIVWSNGVLSEDLQNISSGVYEVTITDTSLCTTTHQFIVENVSAFPLITERIIAETCGASNGAIELSVTPTTGNTIMWSTGDISEDLDQLSSGTYTVTISDANGCTTTHDFIIPATESVDVSLDVDLSAIQSSGEVIGKVIFNIPTEAIERIIWAPDDVASCHAAMCLQQTFSITGPTEITVMVLDTNGCIDQASLMVDMDPEYKIYIPNVFSPGGNETNNRFTVFTNENIEEVVVLEIFNRWGDLLFINKSFPTNDPAYGWDGSYKNRMMNPDVFAYRAVVRYINGKEQSFRGDVTLIR